MPLDDPSDLYDQAHPETGSGNISKASPEWLEILAQARALKAERPDENVLHIAYSLINAQSAEGVVRWGKCPNCGSPFKVGAVSDTVCSETCFKEYLHYINNYDW